MLAETSTKKVVDNASTDLLTLKVSDIADDKGRIKDRIGLREQKTNKIKDLPLGETSRKALNEYLAATKPLPNL